MNIFYTFQDYKPEKHDYTVVLSIYMAVPVTLNKVRYRPPLKITNALQAGIEISSFQYKCIIEVYQMRYHREEKLIITFGMRFNHVNSGSRPFSKMAAMKIKLEYPLCTYYKC